MIRAEKHLVPVLETNALHVLLIEDSLEYAALVTRTLQNQNLCEFEVERASRLDAAIAILDRAKFDAVLLDLTLPDADAETSIELDHFDMLANLTGRSQRSEMIETAYLQLRDRISPADTLARVGESSFALILDDVSSTASVNETANALVGCISCARVPGASVDRTVESIGMAASIGVAMYPDDGRDPTSLRERAEDAQRGASQIGGSAVHFCRDLELYQDYLEKSPR